MGWPASCGSLGSLMSSEQHIRLPAAVLTAQTLPLWASLRLQGRSKWLVLGGCVQKRPWLRPGSPQTVHPRKEALCRWDFGQSCNAHGTGLSLSPRLSRAGNMHPLLSDHSQGPVLPFS